MVLVGGACLPACLLVVVQLLTELCRQPLGRDALRAQDNEEGRPALALLLDLLQHRPGPGRYDDEEQAAMTLAR